MSPPEAGPEARKTRERILAASLDLAGREGLGALTTRRVAEEAGVNLGLLHYYFASKEALVRETLGQFLAELRGELEETMAKEAAKAPQEALVETLVSVQTRSLRRPRLIFGLVGYIAEIMTKENGEGTPEDLMPLTGALSLLSSRCLSILTASLGDEALARRRTLQVFTSLFHPALFTGLAGPLFGLDILSPEGRRAYISGVVADAMRP
jgi:AcrR family transcriptional regulator